MPLEVTVPNRMPIEATSRMVFMGAAFEPLAELYRYSTTLSSLSSGAATYTMKFASYEQVPTDVQDKLLKAYTDTDEE